MQKWYLLIKMEYNENLTGQFNLKYYKMKSWTLINFERQKDNWSSCKWIFYLDCKEKNISSIILILTFILKEDLPGTKFDIPLCTLDYL